MTLILRKVTLMNSPKSWKVGERSDREIALVTEVQIGVARTS